MKIVIDRDALQDRISDLVNAAQNQTEAELRFAAADKALDELIDNADVMEGESK